MQSSRETIFIDIDETSARTIEDGVYPVINAQFGTNFTHDTTNDYRDVFSNIICENGSPINLPRKIEIFNGAILLDRGKNQIRPIAGSIEKILELSKGYNIGMLTARHNMLSEYTPEWVAHHFNGSVSQVLFSNCYHGGNRKKSDICKQEGARIMIEDDMDYSLELAENGILVFLLKKPWNEHRKEKHKNIKKINSWDDLNI